MISTTIEKNSGFERGFAEIAPSAQIDPRDDALFTAAGGAAQYASGFADHLIVDHVSQDDRSRLENDIPRLLGIVAFGERYRFAGVATQRAAAFVAEQRAAIDAVGEALYRDGILSALRCQRLIERRMP